MKPLTLDELRELAPGFVMGTLSLEEQRAFDSALASKAIAEELEAELAAHRAAAEFLAMSQEVPPPPALKGRVMAHIAGDSDGAADIQPERTSGPTRTPSAPSIMPPPPAVTAGAPSSTSGNVPLAVITTGSRGRAAWWSAGLLGAVLAASLLLVVDLRQENTSLRRRLDDQVASLAVTRGWLAARERTLATLLGGDGDVTLVRLGPSQPQGSGMQLFWNVREGKAVVTARGLARIPVNRAYALWMIRDGTPVPVALFTPDSAGRAIVEDITVPTDLQGVAAFAVTEEPSTGSPQPTMTPFLVGAVPRP
jgi:anti-sigma-K factor RskA